MVASGESLIFDWNAGPVTERRPVLFADETLRDGLQSPSVRSPGTEEKLRILHLIESLGIHSADIGLPGAGSHAVRETERLAAEIVASRMRVRPYCAARIEVGPMSGRSNVEYWLENHGIKPDEEMILRVFSCAKESDHVLTDEEILAAIDGR